MIGRTSNHVLRGIYSVEVSKKLMIGGHWVNDYARLGKYFIICCWLLRFEYRNMQINNILYFFLKYKIVTQRKCSQFQF